MLAEWYYRVLGLAAVCGSVSKRFANHWPLRPVVPGD